VQVKSFWIAILLLALSPPALASDLRVAVVNSLRLQSEAPQVAQMREKIRNEFAMRESKTQAQQDLITQLEEKLLRDRDRMSEIEAKSLQRDIRSRTLRLEHAKEELESDRRLRLNEEMDRLRRILAEVVAEVAKAQQLDIVLETGVAWASERADITDKVLARMHELDKSTK
jgi:outer membrane protein